MDSVLINVLATDPDVVALLESKGRAIKAKKTNPCNTKLCGCLQGRPRPDDKEMCYCGHSHFGHTIRIKT